MAKTEIKIWQDSKRKDLDIALYNLGWKNCEAKYQKIIKAMQVSDQEFCECFAIANKHLWDEIRQLDNICPIDYILLTIRDATKIMRCLNKGNKSPYYARKIKALLTQEHKKILECYNKFLTELEDVQKQ